MAARTSTGETAEYRTNTASHSKPHINWFVLGSWSAIILLCLAFWAGVIALFM